MGAVSHEKIQGIDKLYLEKTIAFKGKNKRSPQAHKEGVNFHMVNNQPCNVAKISTLPIKRFHCFKPNAHNFEWLLQKGLCVLCDMPNNKFKFFTVLPYLSVASEYG